MIRLGACVILTAMLAPSVASAQSRHDGTGAAVPDRRGTDEFIALMLTASSYGFRSGTMLNYAFDVRADTDPVLYWVTPSVLALAGITGAVLLDRRSSLRRGRALTAGTALLMGQVGTLALEMYRHNESFPSGGTFASPWTWVGATGGLALGIALGHFADVKPGAGLYVGVGGVGGALLGLFGCGVVQCGSDVGAWALVGQGVGLVTTLATAWAVDPPQREMRGLATGGLAGVLPAVGVLTAYYVRDGDVSVDAWTRVSVVGLAGIVVGAAAGYASVRSTRGTARDDDTTRSVALLPSLTRDGSNATLGITAVGTM